MYDLEHFPVLSLSCRENEIFIDRSRFLSPMRFLRMWRNDEIESIWWPRLKCEIVSTRLITAIERGLVPSVAVMRLEPSAPVPAIVGVRERVSLDDALNWIPCAMPPPAVIAVTLDLFSDRNFALGANRNGNLTYVSRWPIPSLPPERVAFDVLDHLFAYFYAKGVCECAVAGQKLRLSVTPMLDGAGSGEFSVGVACDGESWIERTN